MKELPIMQILTGELPMDDTLHTLTTLAQQLGYRVKPNPRDPEAYMLVDPETDRVHGAAYTLLEWSTYLNYRGFQSLFRAEPHRTPQNVMDELITGITVETEQALLTALQLLDRGNRICAIIHPEDAYDWFMDLCSLGNGKYHGLLYGEYDPEERMFDSLEEVLETFRTARGTVES